MKRGIGDTQKNEKKFEKGIDNLIPRTKRRWVSQDCGSFHIISRLTGSNNLFTIEEKEYLLTLMERLAAGFFISIHAFCIMSNHIHILATGMELEAQEATSEELLRRYKLMFGKERQKGTAKKRSAPT